MAIRQLSALYLTAASAYTVAIILSHHPALAERAGEAGVYARVQEAQATSALESYVLKPGWALARNEAAALAHNVVVALESRVATPEKPGAPPALRHLAAESPSRFALKPKAESFPAPGDAQFVPPPPANMPPPRPDASGLRSGEDEASDLSALRNAPPQAGPSTTQPTNSPPRRVARTDRSHFELAPGGTNAEPSEDTTPGTATSVPNLPPPSTTEIAQVEQRLKDNLTSEMYDNFELFLYVSKAASGPWAQRMYVFQKEPTGGLALAYNWPVSTGREKIEYNAAGQKLPSFTPQGYYEIDPHRLFPHHWSAQWDEPMPYAMFFNWKKDGQDTGIAIHGATGDNVALLGQRASAGCVRLPPEAAKTLFDLIKTKYRGLAPQFAMDRSTGTMSKDGILLHDADGHVQLADGYKVLVFIEDYGGANVVAAMY